MVGVKGPSGPQKGPPPGGAGFDARLSELAGRQDGIVTFAQLRALGLGPTGIKRRVRAGRLHRLQRSVYAVGHPRISLDGRRLAAVMACGPGAALSHVSAAIVLGIRRGSEARFDVTTHERGRKPTAGIRLHRVRRPLGDAVTHVDGIPVTAVARTLLDLADVLAPQQLARAVHEAEALRILDVREVEAQLDGASGRRGAAKLAAALAEPSPGTTRSALEERFADLIAASGLPRPRLNVLVAARGRRFEVDALWPRERAIVELDGAVHRTRRSFHADRARDAALAAEGYVVVRLTWRRVTREPDGVCDELRRLLEVRRAG